MQGSTNKTFQVLKLEKSPIWRHQAVRLVHRLIKKYFWEIKKINILCITYTITLSLSLVYRFDYLLMFFSLYCLQILLLLTWLLNVHVCNYVDDIYRAVMPSWRKNDHLRKDKKLSKNLVQEVKRKHNRNNYILIHCFIIFVCI